MPDSNVQQQDIKSQHETAEMNINKTASDPPQLLRSDSEEAARIRRRNKPAKKKLVTSLDAIPELLSLHDDIIPAANDWDLKTSKKKSSAPDATMYIVRWKACGNIGLKVREVRFKKMGVPMVESVCREECCSTLQHVRIGDILVELNGKMTSLIGVARTQEFLTRPRRSAQLKLRRGPLFISQRIAAA